MDGPPPDGRLQACLSPIFVQKIQNTFFLAVATYSFPRGTSARAKNPANIAEQRAKRTLHQEEDSTFVPSLRSHEGFAQDRSGGI